MPSFSNSSLRTKSKWNELILQLRGKRDHLLQASNFWPLLSHTRLVTFAVSAWLISNVKGLCIMWLTLSLSNDCCLPGAGSLSEQTWGDPMDSLTIFRMSLSPVPVLCATVWVQTLCSSKSQALLSIHKVVSLLLFLYSFLAVYHIHLFGQLADFQCHLFHSALLDGLQLPWTLSSTSLPSFPQSLLLLRVVFLFHKILVFF